MSGDGLVNAAMIPQIKPESATEAAKGLRDMGNGVKKKVTDLNTDWKVLRSCYEAPEQEAVYTLQDPAQHSAEDLATTLDKAAGHLDTYAAELSGLKQKFADLTGEITSFRNRVSGGVEVSCGFLWLDTKTVPWYEDDDTLTDNAHLVGRVNELVAELSKAETTCASQIRALVQVRNSCPAPFTSVTKEQLNAQQDLPWGYAREYEPKNCPESVGYGVKDFVYGLGTGVGSLVLGYDPTTGEYFQGDAYAQSWGGLGNLAGSLAVVSSGGTYLSMGLHAAGVNNGFTQWLDERNLVVANAVTGLVNIDLTAQDPFAKWKKDPWRAGTSGVLNVATFFIPGAGEVAGGLKVGSAGARVAKISAAIADFAVPGGSYAVKAITSIIKFDRAGGILDDVVAVGSKAPSVGVGAADTALSVTRPTIDAPAVKLPSADDFGSVGPQGGIPGAPVRPGDLADLPSGPPRTPTGSVVDPVSTPGHAGPSAPPRTVDPIPATDPARSPELVGVGAKPSPGQVTVEAPVPTRGGEVPGSGRPLGDPSARVGDPAPTSPRPAGADTPPAGNGHPATGGPVDPAPTAGTRAGGTDTPPAGNGHPAGGPADPPPAHPADPPASGDPHPAAADATGHTDQPTSPTHEPGQPGHPDQPGVGVDDRGRLVPVDADGHRVQVNGTNVFYGTDDLLHYEGSGHQVRYADYPAGIDAPTTPDLDYVAQRDDLAAVDATPGYGEGIADTYFEASTRNASDLAEVNRLLDELGLQRSEVAGSQSEALQALKDTAFDVGDVDRVRLLDQLGHAVDVETLSRAQRFAAAEASGMFASLDDFARNDVTPLLGEAPGDLSPGRSRLDTMGIRQVDGSWEVIVDEAKGRQNPTSATLGAAMMTDGTRAQQGTTAYLAHQLQGDPRVVSRLTEYSATHPGFADAWNAGRVGIDYRLVVAAPDGTVRIAHFTLDRSALTLPQIPLHP